MKNIKNAQVAYKDSTISDSTINNNNKIELDKIKRESFWTSLITGILSGLISGIGASYLYEHFFK